MLTSKELFTSFSVTHIIIIVLSILLMTLVAVFNKKIKLEKFTKVLLIIGIITEVMKVFGYTIINEDRLGGYLAKTDLPFHLCSIQIIFFAILNFSKNEKVKRVLYSFMLPTCLVGGFAAILLPTSSSTHYIWIFIQYFSYHIAISCYAMYLLVSKKMKWEFKDFKTCIIMLSLTLFFAIYLNSIIYDGQSNINFMYVINPPQSGLPYLNKDHGWFVYIAHYALLAFFVVSLIYIKPIIIKIKSLFSKKETNN